MTAQDTSRRQTGHARVPKGHGLLVIHCAATTADRLQQGSYFGDPTCKAANVVGGVQGCTYGCLGFGDCVQSCDYDAMTMVDGLPQVNYENCIVYGVCVRICPRNIIEQIPFESNQMLVVACASHDPAKRVRDVRKVGCIGCSLCARVDPKLLRMEEGLAVLDYETYSESQEFTAVLEKYPRESFNHIRDDTSDTRGANGPGG
jgi:ferredoxin